MGQVPVVQQPVHGKARRMAEVIGPDQVLPVTAASRQGRERETTWASGWPPNNSSYLTAARSDAIRKRECLIVSMRRCDVGS